MIQFNCFLKQFNWKKIGRQFKIFSSSGQFSFIEGQCHFSDRESGEEGRNHYFDEA
jgi:hypothetical protein